LNSLNPAGIAPHKLTLKVGAIVMLIRNLNTKGGIVNSTRLLVKRLSLNVIEGEVISGESKGKLVLVPKIT
jgi:ATP-dependent DNA helicase PIF1